MIEIRETTIKFDSKARNATEISGELNDIKLILLSVAFKLDEQSRSQLISELSDVQSDSVKQWVTNLKLANRF